MGPVRASSLAVAASLGIAMLSVRPAAAQEIPADMQSFDVVDLTNTMRDDTFNTITLDDKDPNIAYVGTHQGRVYKTTDAGLTWDESTVIPEQRPLWAVPGGSIFLGGIRDAGPGMSQVSLTGDHSDPTRYGHVPGALLRFTYARSPYDPLADESGYASGGGPASLGVGLSNRAPRLQLLTAVRGRPAPSTNRARFLYDRVLRGTAITSVAVDPDNPQLVFAATVNGVYKSTNGGESWTRTFAGLKPAERYATRIAIRRGEPKLAFLGTGDGLYTSSDNGESWTKNEAAGGTINEIAFDTADPSYIYLATGFGVLRSRDGGYSFDQIYLSSLPAENDVRSLALDPFDPETLYIGTARGAYVTRKARTAGIDDWSGLGGVQSVEEVQVIAACPKHKGHLYAAVTVHLHTINYGAAPPESAVIESWDAGKTWRQLFTGQTDGSVQWFWMDRKDPDQLWIAWTNGIHRLTRRVEGKRTRTEGDFERPEGPTLSELMLATLRYHGLEMNDYADRIKPGFAGDMTPKKLGITGVYRMWSAGGIQDDPHFADERYLQIADAKEWEVLAWASWDLPERVYSAGSVPMMRQRINHVSDELRHQLAGTVQHAYGELLRLRGVLASTKLDLETRIAYRLRADQLEAIIDLTSGGYLTRWYKKRRKSR